jgi:soluble lytic murein transglycosylase
MMSSMQKKALTLFALAASAAAVGAQLAPDTRMHVRTEPVQPSRQIYPQYQQQQQQPAYAPAPPASFGINSSIERWRSLRQSDNLPFSSYASFLTSHRGWPGENAMRRSAEKAIDPLTARPGEVISYFRVLPPLTPTGHARHAAALLAQGDVAGAREAARRAWHGGVLPSTDEERMLSLFGAALTQQDHDLRSEMATRRARSGCCLWSLPHAGPSMMHGLPCRPGLLTLQAGSPWSAPPRRAIRGYW